MAEIGATLREARMRERIDVSEIEATTKIRAKYLRALENEEWDLLPGPTFVKSFLRTYADTLGLDGKALVEEYRLQYEHPSELPEPIVSTPNRGPRTPSRQNASGGGGPSRGYLVLVGIVGIVIVLLIVGLLSGGGGGSGDTQSTGAAATAKGAHSRTGGARTRANTTTRTGTASHATGNVSLTLRATGTVYVCLIGEAGHKLIAGKTFETGERTPTYTAKRFELTLGNNSVALTIDGIPRVIPPSSQAIGYVITKAGRRTLAPGQQPTCT
jgi:cytoskeleton protein RodZ